MLKIKKIKKMKKKKHKINKKIQTKKYLSLC